MFVEDKCLLVQVKPHSDTSEWEHRGDVMRSLPPCPYVDGKLIKERKQHNLKNTLEGNAVLENTVSSDDAWWSQRIKTTQGNAIGILT